MKFKFSNPSESRPDRVYSLTVDTKLEQFTCNCPGFTGHGYCKHARKSHMELSMAKLFVARTRGYRKSVDNTVDKKMACTKILALYPDPHTQGIIRKWGKFIINSL